MSEGEKSFERIIKLRNEIDLIDEKILKLLNRRAEIAISISNEKNKNNFSVFDPVRESEKLKSIAQDDGPFPKSGKLAVFREILSATKLIEKRISVSFLGPEKSFCWLAARKAFGSSIELIPENDVYDIFTNVIKKVSEFGVVPIENSQDGSIGETLDCLSDLDVLIISEVIIPVSFSLLSREEKLSDIKVVYSHKKALYQCTSWIKENLPQAKIEETFSTSDAARKSALEKGAAAVCLEDISEDLGLNVLAKNIQGRKDNHTRFAVISAKETVNVKKAKTKRGTKIKTSVCFSLKDVPGALYKALQPFAKKKINLSKIESRPDRKLKFQYMFFVDIDGSANDRNIKSCLGELAKLTSFFKFLGSYPKDEI